MRSSAVAALAFAALAALTACSSSSPSDAATGVPEAWKDVRTSLGHTAHLATGKVACKDCHDVSTGFTAPSPEVCTRCHTDQHASAIHPGARTDAPDCLGCHAFGAERFAATDCMRCHVKPQATDIAPVTVHAGEDCTTCHRPHAPVSLQVARCEGCHPDQVGFHAGTTGDAGGAPSCLDCHGAHAPAKTSVTRCVTCHATMKPAIGDHALFADGHTTCATCHPPHRAGGSTAVGGSAAFGPVGVVALPPLTAPMPNHRPCADCHADQPVLARAEHPACEGCHDVHDRAAPRPCTTCHADQHVTHPPTANGQTCIGCHPPHARAKAFAMDTMLATTPPGGTPHRIAAIACTSCHPDDSHATAKCTQCHTPHDPAPAARPGLCASCHADRARTVAGTGHADCTGCHRSAAHAPEAPPATCATCHATEVGAVRTGHADCASCHAGGPHAPTAPKVACATCHATESSTAPSGHQACTTCHTPHDGGLKTPVPCASCHAQEAGHGHGTRLDCTTCHRAHGPSPAAGPAAPPACTSCHRAADRPGLHQVTGHTACASCHTSHEAAPKTDRATCMTCHTTVGDHEPTATSCVGCHPFGDGKP